MIRGGTVTGGRTAGEAIVIKIKQMYKKQLKKCFGDAMLFLEAFFLLHNVCLKRGISLSIRNDASFLIDMNMSFYEHQSTYNPNMPLRSAIYYVNTLEDWLRRKNLDLFSRRRIQIPTPHFVVFYNGTEKRPEYEEMRLSEAFCHKTDEPGIEVRCRVYNINPDNNRSLKERSAVLEGYTYFVEKVRTYRKEDMGLEKAVDRAIEDCIENHVLEDFFRDRKDEVKRLKN